MESAHGHGHGPPNAQPPPLHPAMLIANPFVAYAMTNQLIPPAGAPPSVLPGQVIGSPQFIGHHLAGIPGFPGAHHLMGHALSPQQLLPPTSIASPPMNLPPGSWPPNARPIHGNIRDYPPPDFKARESPPEEEIRREDPRSPMNHRSSPSRWPRGVDPYQRRETRDRDPYERRYLPRQPSERRPAYGGDDNRDRDRERGRAYKDRRDEYDSRRNDESWGRRERDSSREREVRSRDRDRDRDRYRERDRDYPSRREGDDRRDGERHRSRSRERDRERDRRSRWNDEERADRGRSRRSRDKSRERRKGERERPMEVQVEFEDGELPEMITEAGTVAQEHRENDREEEHRSEREMVDERVREPSRREDDDRRDRDRREDDVDQRRPDEDEDRRPRERRDEERESGRSRRRSEEREKERERREPRPRLTRVLIRNLDRNMRDDQLAEEVTLSGALPLAVHVMRYRLAGAECSQGFGFVSFYRMEDALVWLERCKYSLKMPGNTEVPMELLSAPPDNMDDDDLDRIRRRTDWACCICRKRNNRRDHRCGSCYAKREDSEVLDGIEDVCSGLSDTILVRNLEPWTTQDNILRVLQATTPLPIKKIELRGGGRSGATCRIELYSSKDANTLMRALEGRDIVTPGGREPVFCFARLPAVETQNVAPNIAIGSAQWAATSQQEQPQILPDSSTDAVGREMPVYDPTNKEASLKSLAEHSASAYAKNPQEWQYYLNYYLNYYRQQADSGALISVKTQSDAALAAASAVRGAVAKAIANPAPQMATGAKPAEIDRTLIGKPGVKLPLPDTLKYVFDSASGLYLDPVTHLYYDQRSQYYYDATNTCYLYWNAKEQNYFPVPQPGAAPNAAVAANENKKEKAKEAQKIAKEMEKWAKSMNQKKDTNKQTSNQGTNSATSDKPASTGAADAGFAVLQGKSSVSIAPFKFGMVSVKTAKPLALPVVEAEEEEEQVAPMPKNGKESEADFTDWHKLACLLCQRRFPSREVLEKHNLISGLHKSNLENWRKAGGK